LRLIKFRFVEKDYAAIMDDQTKTGSPDSKRNNVNEDHEVAYWTKEMGLTKEKLQEAVDAVSIKGNTLHHRSNINFISKESAVFQSGEYIILYT